MSQAPPRSRPRRPGPGELTLLSVYGPRGTLDLTVPASATLAEVAQVYAAQARLDAVLPLHTAAGRPLQPGTTVSGAGLATGSVLIAVDPAAQPGPAGRNAGARRRTSATAEAALRPGALSALWCTVAAVLALLAGWCTAQQPADERTLPVVVLAVAAFLGSLPLGPLTPHRIVAAPAFAAAAAFALAWDPAPERLPTVVGVAALAGAVTAAVGRALNPQSEEALRVWLVVGAGWFAIAALAAIVSLPPQIAWSVLFLVAVLAARFVPALAIDLPDDYLIDLQRLAVTAWSARERPTGRRGRIVVPPELVDEVARRGARIVTAAAAAILVVVLVSGPFVLVTTDLPLDRIGARCLVFFGGAALLFAARSYRHVVARRLLWTAGVVSVVEVTLLMLGLVGDQTLSLATGAVIGLAGVLVLVAVVVGRGWRSAWWSRRAEVAETLCGAFAVSSLVVAVGLFRQLWEITG